MWTTISNIASIVTCVAFLLYLAGHIWVVVKNRHTIYEKLTVLPIDCDIEEKDNVLLVDLNGAEFSIESDYGISKLKIYKVDYDINNDGTLKLQSRSLKATYARLNQDKLFIRCDLGEILPTTQFEIERSDYTIVKFDLFVSGKNGHIISANYKFKRTIKSFLYHLCV